MRRNVLIVVSAIALFGVLLIDTGSQENPESIVSSQANPVDVSRAEHIVLPQTAIEKVVNQPSKPVPDVVFARLPKSLKGAPLPQLLDLEENGALVINEKIKKLFDYFLSAIGEESLEMIVARIKHQLRQLPASANVQAQEILEGYLKYRNELAAIMAQANGEVGQRSFDQIALLREQIADARQALFAPDVLEVFFAKQDQYDNYMYARQKLEKSDLTLAERAAAVELLNASTPDWLVEQQRKSEQVNNYRQLAKTGSNDDLRVLAEREFGINAADRLAKLQLERQQWQQNLSQYHVELSELLKTKTAEGDELERQIQQLRLAYFKPRELRRVAAIDWTRFRVD